MAWNPEPEVAVARDAAKRLGVIRESRVRQCVVIYTTAAGEIGSASYGETKAECGKAKRLADKLFDRAMEFYASGDSSRSAPDLLAASKAVLSAAMKGEIVSADGDYLGSRSTRAVMTDLVEAVKRAEQ